MSLHPLLRDRRRGRGNTGRPRSLQKSADSLPDGEELDRYLDFTLSVSGRVFRGSTGNGFDPTAAALRALSRHDCTSSPIPFWLEDEWWSADLHGCAPQAREEGTSFGVGITCTGGIYTFMTPLVGWIPPPRPY
jgi:hypothetical protein